MKKMIPMMLTMAILVLVAVFFAAQGAAMHSIVESEEQRFHNLQAGYWNLDKQTRDLAPEGSVLNQQLVEIKNYPSELLRLKLVGVGKILTGIFILLFGILIALVTMPLRIGMLLMQGKEKQQNGKKKCAGHCGCQRQQKKATEKESENA